MSVKIAKTINYIGILILILLSVTMYLSYKTAVSVQRGYVKIEQLDNTIAIISKDHQARLQRMNDLIAAVKKLESVQTEHNNRRYSIRNK